MAASNDMTSLLKKIERRLGLEIIEPKLPTWLNKEKWATIIKEDTLVTFSRYFPNKIRFPVNTETCNYRREHGKIWWYIKDEYLAGAKLLGAKDINWEDTTGDNMSLGQTAGYGYYTPNYGGFEDTLNTFVNFQMSADNASLYNNNIFVDFVYPNKINISRSGGVEPGLSTFVIDLLVEHSNLATISPTKMETFEALAIADVARYLFMNLRYWDQLETVYINVDLKLSELENEANKRSEIIEKIEQSYVSASNDNIPYILTVNG